MSRTAPLAEVVDSTLEALDLGDTDQAAAGLARLYAAQIDRSAAIAREASRLAEDVGRELGAESVLYERVQALQAKVTERDTIDRLGARLHAMLVDLLAVPKARAGTSGAKTPGASSAAPGGPLGRLRAVGGAG